MKFFIAGGTGFVGSYLAEELAALGHQVTVLTRSVRKSKGSRGGVGFLEGDPTCPGRWQESVAKHDAVINLAGRSIFTFWTARARRAILDSRTATTRRVVEALAGAGGKTALLSASAVGYYGGHDDDRVLDESSPPGSDFLARVGVEWEAEAKKAEAFGVRVALCRFGIVLGRNGGALASMARAARYRAVSPLGTGKQWFPWIHQEDLLRIMLFLAENEGLSGPVNCTAPLPVRNEELTRALSEALRKPLLLPAIPAFAVRTMLGEFGSVLLKGQRALPVRLSEAGFVFRFPELRGALESLLR
ncbi:MAG: TIGR01777 family oxidoreductase [Syntrophobacteraceae bacterium]|nr:TIGR01777 family oxidoreductase [Desulfobacteraceae bacterium]